MDDRFAPPTAEELAKFQDLSETNESTEPAPPTAEELAKYTSNIPSRTEAAVRGLAQGATLGFTDEATSGAEALLAKIQGEDATLGSLYEQKVKEARDLYKRAKEEHPGTYTAGELGGSVATSFIPGLNIAKGASVASMAGKAALQSGIQSLGASEEFAPADIAKDAALGATLGAVGGKVGQKFEELSTALKNKNIEKNLQKYAQEKAALALGARKYDLKTPKKLEQAQELGRQTLEKGILTPFGSTEEVLGKVSSIKEEASSKINDIISKIDSANLSKIDANSLKQKVFSSLDSVYKTSSPSDTNKYLDQISDSLTSLSSSSVNPITGKVELSNIPLSDLQQVKRKFSEIGYPGGKAPLSPTEKQNIYQKAKQLVDESLQEETERSGQVLGEKLLSKYRDAKKDYGFSKEASTMLSDKLAGEKTKDLGKLLSQSVDVAAIAAAPFTGGASLTGLVAKKGAEALLENKNQLAAVGANKLSSVLATKGDKLARYSDMLAATSKRLPRTTTRATPTTVTDSDISDSNLDSMIEKARNSNLNEKTIQQLESMKELDRDARNRSMSVFKSQPALRQIFNQE